MKVKLFVIILFVGLFIFGARVYAHPGRTDASGCHTCRTNCSSWGLSRGEYHCHRAKALPQPKEPIRSTFGENGTGYTQPAPEYKIPARQAKSPTTEKSVSEQIETPQSAKIIDAVEKKSNEGFWQRLFKSLGFLR